MSWQPTATWVALQRRAAALSTIRSFFQMRDVCEVETPLMGKTTSPDRHIEPLQVKNPHRYLHTSPEFAMKRLLAAGYGDCYQICKVFRSDECGARHNPEFTMLEWYRLGWDHHALMQEMDALLQTLYFAPAKVITYQAIFEQVLGVDPLTVTPEALAIACGPDRCPPYSGTWDLATWLDYCFSVLIEPNLGHDAPLFVTNFPAAQAALARIEPDGITCARFEVYLKGMELANGYYELGDAAILEARFIEENKARVYHGQEIIPLDRQFLAAHVAGLPPCAGVALGVDRLMMALLQTTKISEVVSFTSASI